MQYATSAQPAAAAPPGMTNGTADGLSRDGTAPGGASLVELQASLGFLHDQAAAGVRHLYDYVEQHSPAHPELGGCLAPAVEASRAFAAADYGRALAEILRVYREVAQARAANPGLPPLSGLARAAGAG